MQNLVDNSVSRLSSKEQSDNIIQKDEYETLMNHLKLITGSYTAKWNKYDETIEIVSPLWAKYYIENSINYKKTDNWKTNHSPLKVGKFFFL